MITAYCSSAAYVEPFARSWHGLSITDPNHMQSTLLCIAARSLYTAYAMKSSSVRAKHSVIDITPRSSVPAARQGQEIDFRGSCIEKRFAAGVSGGAGRIYIVY